METDLGGNLHKTCHVCLYHSYEQFASGLARQFFSIEWNEAGSMRKVSQGWIWFAAAPNWVVHSSDDSSF